jgi:hypothetical protein
MAHRRNPEIESKGTLLAFSHPERSGSEVGGARGMASFATRTRRQQRVARWSGRFWIVLAWMIGANHVELAIARHQVFALQDYLAFLLVVVMPILRSRQILEAFDDARRLLR